MILELSNKHLQVKINTRGAELWSIQDKQGNHEHIWQGNANIWSRRSPNLFPICGNLKEGKIDIDENSYHIPLHGFARDYEHKVVEHKQDSLTLIFTDNTETYTCYPFSFKLLTKYVLIKNKVECYLKVVNTNLHTLPFSIGYHTGFNCPLNRSSRIDNCYLKFEQKETINRLLCTEKGLLTGEKAEFLKEEKEIKLIGSYFPGTCILEGIQSQYIELVNEKADKKLRIGIKGFPYLVLWISQSTVPFVCIEPWYGLPDLENQEFEIKDKLGICKLDKEESFECMQSIEVLPNI